MKNIIIITKWIKRNGSWRTLSRGKRNIFLRKWRRNGIWGRKRTKLLEGQNDLNEIEQGDGNENEEENHGNNGDEFEEENN